MNKQIEKELAKLTDSEYRQLTHRIHIANMIRSFSATDGLSEEEICERLKITPKLFRLLRNAAFDVSLNEISDIECLKIQLAEEQAKREHAIISFPDYKYSHKNPQKQMQESIQNIERILVGKAP